MAYQTVTLSPLDPYVFTGPTRATAGVAKTLQPTLDSLYGVSGTVEYMRWVYIGVSGNLAYTKWDGTTETLVGLAAGVWHPIYSIKINSSGTTATNIVVGS